MASDRFTLTASGRLSAAVTLPWLTATWVEVGKVGATAWPSRWSVVAAVAEVAAGGRKSSWEQVVSRAWRGWPKSGWVKMSCARSGVAASASSRRLHPAQTAGASAGGVPVVDAGPDWTPPAECRMAAMRLARPRVRCALPGLTLEPMGPKLAVHPPQNGRQRHRQLHETGRQRPAVTGRAQRQWVQCAQATARHCKPQPSGRPRCRGGAAD